MQLPNDALTAICSKYLATVTLTSPSADDLKIGVNTTKGKNINQGLSDVFSNIYERHIWGTDGGGSGEGSSITITQVTRGLILQLIDDFKVRNMVDGPCGSFHWMRLVVAAALSKYPDFKYTGYDVVESKIKKLEAEFSGNNSINFFHADLATVTFPNNIDLFFCRDALQHLSYVLIWKILRNIQKADPAYAVLGSYHNNKENTDINIGEYFLINLAVAPFTLKPFLSLHEKNYGINSWPSKFLYIYTRLEIRAWEFPPVLLD